MINEEHWFRLWDHNCRFSRIAERDEIRELEWMGLVEHIDDERLANPRGVLTVSHYAFLDPDA